MKYEIIFKNGKIKNVVSKDVNKIKNYITESFDSIKSYKRLDEAKDSQKIKDLLENLCYEFDYKIQYKQFDISYNPKIDCYYIAYVANSGYIIKECIKAFGKVLKNWVKGQKSLPSINCKVFFSERDGNGSQRAWDIKECMRDSDMYNIFFQTFSDGDNNLIPYYGTQINPERKVEGMYSIAYIDEFDNNKQYVAKYSGGYAIIDDLYNDWDDIYKTVDKKAAREEIKKVIEFFGSKFDSSEFRVVKTPARR